MGKQITEISCFLSSPSDIQEERKAVGKVIEEYNRTHSDYNNVSIKLLSWENTTFPSMGESAQSVINNQIGDNFDVFIGIIAHRIGTPTKNFLSGTLEEFERAFKRYKDEGNVDIMFYFKKTIPDINKIDITELKKIQDFKNSLDGLYFDYTDAKEFEEKFREHFQKKINAQLNENKELQFERKFEQALSIEPTFEDEVEIGYFELSENLQEASLLYSQNMSDLTKIMSDYSEETGKITEEINIFTKSSQKENKVIAKTLTNKGALALQKLSSNYEIQFPKFKEIGQKVFTYFVKTLERYVEMHGINDEFLAQLNTTIELKGSIEYAKDSMVKFKQTVHNTPKMTNETIKAVKNTEAILEKMINEIEEMIQILDRFLNKYSN